MTPPFPGLDFEGLYRTHRDDVYRAALRELGDPDDAEDVTQAAFADAYRAVLRGSRPEFPRAWLLAIAENVRRRRFRTALRRPREEPLDEDAALAAEETHEQAATLLAALESLTREQREAFLLREIVGLSYEEIAERTGTTVGSVQMLLFRARRTLRGELEPPAVRGALLPFPGWLAGIAQRADSIALTPRVAGAAGAAAVAVAGVTAGVSALPSAPEPRATVTERDPRPRDAEPALPLVVRAPVPAVARPKPAVVEPEQRPPATAPAAATVARPQQGRPVTVRPAAPVDPPAPASPAIELPLPAPPPPPATPTLPAVTFPGLDPLPPPPPATVGSDAVGAPGEDLPPPLPAPVRLPPVP